MNKEQKTALVEEIAGQLKDSDAVFAVDYRGISVPQAAELRARLRDADATFRIVKNSLTERAAEKAGADSIRALLDGPTALTFVRGDAALAAKALAEFSRAADLLEFKGGFMDGEEVSVDEIKAISRLPGRDVLHAQLVGMTAAPLTGLVGGLNALIAGLALQLGQIAEQGLVTGEAPPAAEPAAAPPEEPAAEEAPAEGPAADEKPAEEPAAEEAPAEEPVAEEKPADEPAAEETPAETGEETATEADAPAAAAQNDDNAAEA
ncbi:MAG TPA: 50S ribosomal protein L10 [Solirubrobacteraceae bacterium]|nr:50S ribosomal protein L10 [Solirubrobacteraceae bacterium]